MPNETEAIRYLGGLLIALIVWVFLDARNKINEKADKEALGRAVESWKEDLKEAKELHQRETARLEHQYEVKFDGVVKSFSDQITAMKSDLSRQIDMVLQLLQMKGGKE